jgi:hypothetical protein
MNPLPQLRRPLRARRTTAVERPEVDRWWEPGSPTVLDKRRPSHERSASASSAARWAILAACFILATAWGLWHLAEQRHRPDMDRVALLREKAHATEQEDPAESVRCYQYLRQSGVATRQDNADLARLLVSRGDLRLAEVLASELRGSPEGHLTTTRLALAQQQTSTARDSYHQLVHSGHGTVAEGLALLQLCPTDLTCVEDLFTALQQQKSQLAHASLLAHTGALAALPWKDAAMRRSVADLLLQAAAGAVPERLAALRLSYPADISRRDWAQLQQNWQDVLSTVTQVEEARAAVAVLMSHRAYDLAESLLSRLALADGSLQRTRAEALLALGHWREAAQVRAPSLADNLRPLATLAQKPMHPVGAEPLLRQALTAEQQPSFGLALSVAMAALEHQLPDLAQQAFTRALSAVPAAQQSHALEAVVNAARSGGMPAAQLARALHPLWQQRDPATFPLCSYVKLLAGDSTGLSSASWAERHSSHSAPGVYDRFIQALALHREGSYLQAVKLLTPLPAYRWHQGEAAVLGAMLASAGGAQQCQALTASLNLQRLFPEEREMITPWLQVQTVMR